MRVTCAFGNAVRRRASATRPLPASLRAQRALHKVGGGFQRAVFNRLRASVGERND